MRRLIVPTCLFISAWAPPAGPIFETFSAESPINVTVVDKTTPSDETAQAIAIIPKPSETTEQVLSQGDDPIAAAMNTEPQVVEVKPPVIPLPPHRALPHRIVCEELAVAAVNNDLPAPFLIKLINQESGFNQNAVSPVGAQGVAQFMPEVAAKMQLADPFDPLKALHASAQLLRNLIGQFGNLGLAAAAYNAGPRRVQDWLAKKGKLPQETRDYVQRITGRAPEEWKSQRVSAQMRVPSSAPCQREAGLFASNGPAAIPMPVAAPGVGGKIVVAKKSVHRIKLAARSPAHDVAHEAAAGDKTPQKPVVVASIRHAAQGHKAAKKVQVSKVQVAKAQIAKVQVAKVQVAEARAPQK